MKIKLCTAPVYLHSTGSDSIHVDVEHPMLDRILLEGEQAHCQGKGHGIFISLAREMIERARGVMRMFSSSGPDEPTLLNDLVAGQLDQIADLHAANGDDNRSLAFRRAARSVQSARDDIHSLASTGRLRSLQGVGPAIASVIEECLEGEECTYLRDLRSRTPGLSELLDLDRVDTGTAILLNRRLGVGSLEELDRAYGDGRIVLQPQPVTLEELVGLEVLGRRSPGALDVLGLIFDDLSFIEQLNRQFTAHSIVYGLPKVGRTRTLFSLTPTKEGVRVDLSPVALPERYDDKALLGSLSRIVALSYDQRERATFLLVGRETAWGFCRCIRDALQGAEP